MSEHRSRTDGPWLWMSKAGMERALFADGVEGLAIYAALCRLESDAKEEYKNAFFASHANIAKMSGCGERTVKRHLPLLQKAGLFRMESGRSSKKGEPHSANKFTLLGLGDTSLGQRDTSPCAAESGLSGPHKRTFFHGVKKKGLGNSEKESGIAGASPADAGSADVPRKRTSCIGGF